MDVHCSTCDEPWDVHHLREDAIFETDLTLEEAQDWIELPPGQQLIERYRSKFRALNWEFGRSIINVISCPCCPSDAAANPESVAIKAALEDVLGDDEDGLAATFEDYDL